MFFTKLCFACVILLVIDVQCQEPQIVEDILPEVKSKGQSGYLNCTVSRQGDNKVYWIHEDQHISSDTQILAWNQEIDGKLKFEIYRQYRGNDKIVYMLVVNRLREEDDGKYLCQIYLRGVDMVRWPSKYTTLTVQAPPTIVVSATSNTMERQQGSSVEFTCNATGSPTPNITWIRADGKALPGGQLSHRGHTFVIPTIRKDDRGTYRCVADNTVAPPDLHDAKLIVYFSPESKPVQDTVGQAQNRRFTAILECIIAGMPEPVLRWYRKTNVGQVAITDNEKYEVSQLLNHGSSLQIGEVWFSLKILNVQANDYTEYTCEGQNDMGKSGSIIQMFETNECQGPDCPSIGSSNVAATLCSFSLLHIIPIVILYCALLDRTGYHLDKKWLTKEYIL